MTEEKERETNRRDNSGPGRTRDFKLEICAEDSAQQKQRRKRGDPKSDLLEARWFDCCHVACEAGFLG